MASPSRRNFLKMAGLAVAAGAFPASTALTQDKQGGGARNLLTFGLGVASYSFRSFTLDQTVAMTKRLGIERLALKDVHLPLSSSAEEIAAVLAKMKAAGTEIITDIDKKPFQDAVKPVWDKYGAKYAAMVKRIEAVN